jgi:hypothetical protein
MAPRTEAAVGAGAGEVVTVAVEVPQAVTAM